MGWLWGRKEKGDGGGFSTERASKDVALASVEGADDQIMVYGLVSLTVVGAL